MDNSPAVDGIVVKKTNVLFEVTPVSRILAAFLFVLLPFIGGWVGYNLNSANETDTLNSTLANINGPQNNINTSTQSNYFSIFEEVYKLENADWASSTVSHLGKEIVIEYPANMPIRKSGLSHPDPGRFTFGLFLEIDDLPSTTLIDNKVLWATYTQDLKYLFYLKNNINHSALYVADVQAKQIKNIATYDFFPNLASMEKARNPLHVPEVSNGWVIYNRQVEPGSEKFVGVITSLNNFKRLWEAPCERDGWYDFSSSNTHILWTCTDGIYVSDWVETKKILTDSETLRPRNATFTANDRITFYSALNDHPSDSQRYSVKIDGTDLILEDANPSFNKPE